MLQNILSYTGSFYSSTGIRSEDFYAGLMVAIIAFIITLILLYVVNSIFLSKVFKKAGIPGFIAWIPFWSNWQLFEMGGQKGYLSLIPTIGSIIINIIENLHLGGDSITATLLTINGALSIAYLVFFIKSINNINKNLDKGTAYTVLGVFFYTIWLGILAFDKSTWQGVTYSQVAASTGTFAQKLESPYANNQANIQTPTYMPQNTPEQAPASQQQDTNQNNNQPPSVN